MPSTPVRKSTAKPEAEATAAPASTPNPARPKRKRNPKSPSRTTRLTRRRFCDRCRANTTTSTPNTICTGTLPCTRCTSLALPCHYSHYIDRRHDHPRGRAWVSKRRVAVYATPGVYRTEALGPLRKVGRVGLKNTMGVGTGGWGSRAFAKMVGDWGKLPKARGMRLPGVGGQVGGDEERRTVLEASARLVPPSPDLLDALHQYAAHTFDPAAPSAPTPLTDATMLYSLDRSALLALGVLTQEYLRSLVPGSTPLSPDDAAHGPTFADVAGPESVRLDEMDKEKGRRGFAYEYHKDKMKYRWLGADEEAGSGGEDADWEEVGAGDEMEGGDFTEVDMDG